MIDWSLMMIYVFVGVIAHKTGPVRGQMNDISYFSTFQPWIPSCQHSPFISWLIHQDHSQASQRKKGDRSTGSDRHMQPEMESNDDCGEANGSRVSANGKEHITSGSSIAEESGNDEIERSKVLIMRALVETQDSSAKEVDDLMIRRFLRARELDIEKASNLFLKYLSWRRSFTPNGFISPSEIPKELAQNKLFMQGVDKQNRPVVVVFGARHKPYKRNLDEFKRFVAFTLDRICARMPAGQEKFVSIADLEGWGYSNSDIRGYLAALSILQDCYPERLGKLFIVHVPYIFMAAWKVVYPFIDNKTKKKIIFVENKKLRSTLLDDINESELPDVYGGKLSLVPIQDT